MQTLGRVLGAVHAKDLARDARDLYRITNGFASHRRGQAIGDGAYQSLVRLFCRTKGYSNDLMSWVISKVRRPYDFSGHKCEGVLGSLDRPTLLEIDSDLRKNGYHVFEKTLSPELCDRLLKFALSNECLRRPMSSEGVAGRKATPIRARFDRANPSAVRLDFTCQDLVDDADVQKLISDLSLVSVAQTYLDAAPILDIVTMWWHTAYSKEPDPNAAQLYHFDMDRIRWLKFFFYLTDVGPENGPHCFVAGSHRSGGIPEPLLKRGYARITDEDVEQYFPKDRLIKFVGPRGTIIAEDTRGLHKGQHVERGDRLVFQLEFCNSLFGGETIKASLDKVRDPRLQAMRAEFPGIYSMFS